METHLAIGLGIRACQAGHRVLFATASEWVVHLAGDAQVWLDRAVPPGDRVDGSPVGYGNGIDRKQILLDLERRAVGAEPQLSLL